MKTRKTKETKAFDVKVGANLRAIRMEQGFSVWGLAEAPVLEKGLCIVTRQGEIR